MAASKTDGELSPARRKRIRMLKRIISMIPLVTLILLILCIVLTIQLCKAKAELKAIKAERNSMDVVSTDVWNEQNDLISREQTDLHENTEANTAPQATPMDALALEDAWRLDPRGENTRYVYLTFDDGPSSNTGKILDILAQYDVKATFFVIGKEGEGYQALYNRIVDEGHTLAMHSYSHKYDEIYQSVENYSLDLSKLQEYLYEVTGVWCRYCRFPGGSSNTVSRIDMHDLIAYLDEQDIQYFDWNVLSGDATNTYISKEDIVRNCTSTIATYKDAMILFHDASNKNTTVEALPEIIETILDMDDTRIVPITDETEPIHHISND